MNEAQLATLKQFTEDNNHGAALWYVAAVFNFKKYETLFQRINDLHEAIGYLPLELKTLRERYTQEVFDHITEAHGEEVANKVHQQL